MLGSRMLLCVLLVMLPLYVACWVAGRVAVMTAWYTREDMAVRCGVSVAALRKAQSDGRIKKVIKSENGMVLIADDDEQVGKWIGDVPDVVAMRREIANLSKRVRQAERKADRAERERIRTLERFASLGERLTTVNAIVASAAVKALGQDEDVRAEVINES